MSERTKVLIIEDLPSDAELARREIAKALGECEFRRVETRPEFLEALETFRPAVIVSDFLLPQFDGLTALKLASERCPDVPFIIATGSMNEDTAVECMKAGAWDYVIKEHIKRLGPAVQGALERQRTRIEARRAEHDLEASETRYRRLFEAAKDGILILDAVTGEIVDVNPFLVELTGHPREHFLGNRLWEIGSLKNIAASEGSFAELQAQKYVRYEDRPLVARDGREIAVEFVSNVYRVDGESVIQCNIRDITERERAERELAFRNLVLSTQQEVSIDGILVVDVNGGVISSNRRFADMWGIPPDVIESRSDERSLQLVMDTLTSPDEFIGEVKRLYAAPNEEGQDEIALKDGRTFDRHSAPMIGADGRHFGRVWFFRDITERKRVEEALRASASEFRTLADAMPQIVWITRPDGWNIFFNQQWMDYTGLSLEDSLGHGWNIPFHPDDQQRAWDAWKKATLENCTYSLESRLRRADGAYRWWLVRGVPKLDAAGQIIKWYGTCTDIHDLKMAEKEREEVQMQLQASQKLEAIGSLAGGVAHDFNNLLSAILGFNKLAMEGLREGDPIRDDLKEVKEAGDRAVALTRQLLAFSRKQLLQPVPLSLNQIVEGLEKMLRRILGEDIDIVHLLAPDLGLTVADPGQIEQVLMNLVVNARDAMPAGGRVIIETSNVEIDEEYASLHVAVKPGPYVRLVVTDTGSGMDGQTKDRIFEPFFTTKDKGKGTGLGLSTVYGIVKQSGGNIWVYSEPGQGTTFKVYLPRELSACTPVPTKLPALTARATGTETILVVEDEDALRRLVRRALEEHGYTVLTAANGDEALLASVQYAGDIHILVTDVVMPGMSGRTLARELSKTRPTLKVLYMSGYTDNAIVHHGVLDAGTRFLGKPFSSADLVQKVREVLDEGIIHRVP